MTIFATVDDLTARFPRALTAEEAAQVDTMLADASFVLSSKAPGLQAAIDSGDEDITHAAMLLVVAMTKRSLLAAAAQQSIVNPAVSQMSETWGSFSQTLTYKTGDGSLWLYPNELEVLLGMLRGDQTAAVSMRG